MGRNKPDSLVRLELNSTALVWNEIISAWEIAYIRDFRRTHTFKFIDAVSFNSSDEVYTSEIFNSAPYQTGALLLIVAVTGTPTDIYFKLQFSDDGRLFYNYALGPFGDLRYEDGAGDIFDCLDFPVVAPYFRIYAVSRGCDSSNYFTVTSKVVFNG